MYLDALCGEGKLAGERGAERDTRRDERGNARIHGARRDPRAELSALDEPLHVLNPRGVTFLSGAFLLLSPQNLGRKFRYHIDYGPSRYRIG